MWDLRNTREAAHVEAGGRMAAVNKISFDPSGNVVALACQSGVVKFLQTIDYSIKNEIQTNDESCQAVLFDRTGEYLVSSGNGKNVAFDLVSHNASL